MTRITLLLVAMLAVAIAAYPAGQGFAQTLGYTGCGGAGSPPVSNAASEQLLIELVNAQRASHGNLPPLKRADALDQAARYYATDMALDFYFESSHSTYDRGANFQLVEVCNFGQRLGSYYTNGNRIGENIAAGQPTPQEVIQDWMASSGHRANILSTEVWEIGIGFYPAGPYGSSWVQDFGRRSGVYPLVIEREDDVADTRTVDLFIYGQGTWSEMRLRNDDDAWGGWQPFQSQVSWTLANLTGVRTVWVEMRQGAQTYLTNDTIFFNAQPPASATVQIFLPIAIR